MYAVGRLGSYIQRGVYRVSDPFHPFGGAVDIIVVQQEDGSFKSSRWNVRFGKFQGVLKAKERIVRISVNGVEADFNMYLDHKGEAYFLREFDEEEGESLMHPTTSPGDDTDDCSKKKKRAFNSGSCNFEARMSNSADQFDVDKGKVLTRAGSRRSGILGFVFGRSSMKAGEYNEGDHGPALTRVDSLERAEIAADLLEVKWSTNLTSLRPQKKVSSGFRALVNTENNSTTNVESGDSDGNVCYNKEQVSFSAESSFHDCGGFVGETISLSTSDQAVERPEVGGNMFELIGEVSEDTGAHTNRLGLHKPSVELEYCPDKHLVEEKNSSEIIVGLPATKIYKEEFTTDDSQLYVHSKPLESSNRGLQNSTEAMNLASERSRSIHIHNELFHTTSAMLPQVTHTEELDPQKGQKGSPESNSRQTDITCSCVNDFNDADAQRPPMLTKPLTINPDHCISSSSDFSNMCYETHSRNDTRDIDIPNMFGSPLESANSYDLTEGILKSPSISSEEENFIFGDLDEYKIIEGQCTKSFLCKQEDQDNPSSNLDATEKHSQLIGTNACLPSSHENFVEDRETSDRENFRVRSSPIHIQRNYSLGGDLVEHCTGSLPVMSSHSCNLSQRGVHHPRSLSVDLRSKSFSWEFHGKCMEGDEDNEKNMDISGMVNTIDASTTVEISLCKHLLSEGMGACAAAEAFDSEKLDVEKFRSLGPQVVKDEKLVVRIGHYYFPWDAAAPIILGMASFGSERIFEAKGMIPIDKNLDGDPSNSSIPSDGNWSLWPFSFRKSRSQKAISSLENLSEIPIELDEKVQIYPKLTKKTVKAYAPTSEQLASLNLKEGRNIVTFTFCTAMLGNQQVDARIYLWKWNTRIVISDVDGTITKSDVLGQFMPLVGIDWSQTGVAHLFSAIKENGYQLLFLSARAISQAFRTRRFLFNLKQDGKALPDGPVFISPDGLFPSLYREVIRRAPHEFKIACLEDIKSLFPAGCNPFYAGFGNRYTDEISYRKVGIPKGKIFIINPKGEVAVNRRLDTKSYTSLHALVNGMFPPMNSSEQEDYNAWNYWKLPPPDIDI